MGQQSLPSLLPGAVVAQAFTGKLFHNLCWDSRDVQRQLLHLVNVLEGFKAEELFEAPMQPSCHDKVEMNAGVTSIPQGKCSFARITSCGSAAA